MQKPGKNGLKDTTKVTFILTNPPPPCWSKNARLCFFIATLRHLMDGFHIKYTNMADTHRVEAVILKSIHVRRIYTVENAKVVASVWGTELIQLLVPLAIFQQDDIRKGLIAPG